MAGEKVAATSYGIFTNAVATTNTMNNNISDGMKSIESCKGDLNNGDIFEGPICDSCMEGFSSISTKMTSMTSNYTSVADYLMHASDSYQKTDSSSSKDVTSVSKNSLTTNTSQKRVSTTAYANPAGLEGDHLEFVNDIKDGAVQAYEEYGVLPSLTLAQAILETGWGSSKIGNNIFGIKTGDSWTGKVQTLETGEQNPDGSRYTTVADFRDYDTIDESIVDHAELLNNERYQPVIEATNYQDACRAVKECGYATDLDYDGQLITLIEQYGLDQWDPK